MYGLSRCPHFQMSTLITGSTVYVLNDTHRFDKTKWSLRQAIVKFLNQARDDFGQRTSGFLKLLLSGKLICMCVCVSAPQAINNYSIEMKPE